MSDTPVTLDRSELIRTDRAAIDDPGQTLGDLVGSLAARVPERVALVDGSDGRRWTYAELWADALSVAGFLRQLAGPGDRIAICGPNTAEWVVAELGAALAGMVIVGINPALTEAEIGYAMRQSGARVAAATAEYRGTSPLALFRRLAAALPGLETVLPLEDALTWAAGQPGRPDQLPAVRPEDPLLIQYTSGTTGAPKGAILTHGGLTVNMRLIVERFAVAEASTWLGVVPMHHLTGSVTNTIGPLCCAGTHVIASWDPADTLGLIGAERVTVLQAVPTMLLAMMERPEFASTDLSSLELVVSGGTVVLPEVITRCEKQFGCDFTVVFGQTEAGAYICATHRTDSVADRTERVGTPLSCFDVRITDPAGGAVVPCGTVGEIWLRGPSVMRGYHDMAEQTAATLTADGWMRTGDLGFLDDRGYMQVTGKLKDVIIRSGVNVYPREIENRLAAHPDVADAAVVGVRHERLGEEVAAFVRMAPGRELDEAALTAFARQTLAAYKVPSVWRAVTAFPVTASGKIRKFQLREDFEASRAPAG